MEPEGSGLTIAVTGPTGTFGQALIPQLEADDRVGRIVGVARRPFDPARYGWTKMTYRQGDVRDRTGLEEAFHRADVVVHLAFLITGTASRETTRSINIDGTISTFRAAVASGAKRFVYASSVAAYGFHPDNPIGMTEDWPARPANRLFYAQEKAELEELLSREAAANPDMDVYILRPPVVLGPNAVGAKAVGPRAIRSLLQRIATSVARAPVPVPLFMPALPMQLVHEDDVAQALLLCIVAAGAPGTYNIAGEGTITTHDVARELRLRPLPVPVRLVRGTARALSAVPTPAFVPPVTEWIEALGHPVIVDTAKARRELGWNPQHTTLEALRSTLPLL